MFCFFAGDSSFSSSIDGSPINGRGSRGHLSVVSESIIDNKSELVSGLGLTDVRADSPDWEVLLASYIRWGEKVVDKLRGDFSFVVYDASSGKIFGARDHLGLRPFYYTTGTAGFYATSTLASVLDSPGWTNDFDEPYLAASLRDKYFFHPERTYWESVRKLPPAHTISVTRDRHSVSRYWGLESIKPVDLRSIDDCAEAFLELYSKVVGDCVEGDFRVASHLSGGLDSSSVSVLASRELRRRSAELIRTYSWEPQPSAAASPNGVYESIESVVEQERLTNSWVHPSGLDLVEALRIDPTRVPAAGTLVHELPVQDRAQKDGVHRILSGWGGDHAVTYSGKGYYPELFLVGRWRELARHGRMTGCNQLWFFLSRGAYPVVPERIRSFVKQRRIARPFSFLNPDFEREVSPLVRPVTPSIGMRRAQWEGLTGGFITSRLESWAEVGATRGLTYRYPLLDRRLLEFALGLPEEQFICGSRTRRLAHHAFGRILPEPVCRLATKFDEVRIKSLLGVFRDGFSRIREILADHGNVFERQDYVDVARLKEHLDSEAFRLNPKLGQVRPALQFLDF